MKLTEEYIRRHFAEYNATMFGGRLPEPPIELTSAKTFLGQCCSKIVRLPDGRKQHRDFRLRFSTLFDIGEPELQDTIIHEMIHYFILLNGLTDTSAHGEIFKSLMRSINTNFNRNIEISHRETESAQRAASTPCKLRVVARIELKSGKTGFKVIPATPQSVNKFISAVRRCRDISKMKLYGSTNPFFSHYPSSAALKIHIINTELLDSNLTDAQELRACP